MKTDKQKNLLIEQLKKTPIVQIACEKTGVGRTTYYRWRKENPNFAKLADEAIAEGEAIITDMTESQLISLIKDRNFPAIQLWLRHHHPSYKTKVEIEGKIKTVQEITPEQKELIKRALKLADLTLGKEQNNE